MKIRDLQASDLFHVATIFEKVSAEVVEKIDNEISERQAGIHIFLAIAKTIPNEIREFIAHISDITVEELDKMPFNYPIKVVKELLDRQEIKDFFTEIKDLIAKATTKQ